LLSCLVILDIDAIWKNITGVRWGRGLEGWDRLKKGGGEKGWGRKSRGGGRIIRGDG